MGVNVPVADLRAQPRTRAEPGVHDPLQETQLLYGERVRVRRIREGWASVEAVEQPEFTHTRRWQGYPGWVPVSSLVPWRPPIQAATPVVVTEKWAIPWQDPYSRTASSWRFSLGSRLWATDMGGHVWKVELLDGAIVWMPRGQARPVQELAALPASEKRSLIVRSAQLFVGEPYYWGGRSPRVEGRAGGVDCSGLVNLAYRAAGLALPRDAHEQWLRARPVGRVQPADLIFLSDRQDPQRIVHVMLYAGAEELIEGPGTGRPVRRLALAERLGRPLDQIGPGDVVDGQTVWFGTYFP